MRLADPGRGDDKERDADHGHGDADGPPRGEPRQACPEGALGRHGRRSGALERRVPVQPIGGVRQKQQPAEDRERGGHEGDRHGETDQDGQRHARSQGAKESQRGGQQA